MTPTRIRSVIAIGPLVIFMGGCAWLERYQTKPLYFEMTRLPAALASVGAIVDKGFTASEIAQVANEAAAMPVGEFKQFSFPIAFLSSDTDLRIHIKREAQGVVKVMFFTSPALVKQIDSVMHNGDSPPGR